MDNGRLARNFLRAGIVEGNGGGSMTDPHQPASFPTDPHPVRPGTSAALTARTIDATVHPPIVRAQEAVAEAIPRLAVTVTSPLFLTTVGLTLVMALLIVRLRTRMVWLVLSAIMVMTLTSFRPVRGAYKSPSVDDTVAREYEPPQQVEVSEPSPPTPASAPFVFRIPTRPHAPSGDMGEITIDQEEFRAAVEELRQRIEAELRHRAEREYHYQYQYHYRMRSARWMRRLPPSLQEWVAVGQQTVAAWDRNP